MKSSDSLTLWVCTELAEKKYLKSNLGQIRILAKYENSSIGDLVKRCKAFHCFPLILPADTQKNIWKHIIMIWQITHFLWGQQMTRSNVKLFDPSSWLWVKCFRWSGFGAAASAIFGPFPALLVLLMSSKAGPIVTVVRKNIRFDINLIVWITEICSSYQPNWWFLSGFVLNLTRVLSTPLCGWVQNLQKMSTFLIKSNSGQIRILVK